MVSYKFLRSFTFFVFTCAAAYSSLSSGSVRSITVLVGNSQGDDRGVYGMSKCPTSNTVMWYAKIRGTDDKTCFFESFKIFFTRLFSVLNVDDESTFPSTIVDLCGCIEDVEFREKLDDIQWKNAFWELFGRLSQGMNGDARSRLVHILFLIPNQNMKKEGFIAGFYGQVLACECSLMGRCLFRRQIISLLFAQMFPYEAGEAMAQSMREDRIDDPWVEETIAQIIAGR